jgi:protease-4
MGKFLLGLVTGIVLVVAGVVIVLFAAARFSERPPSVAANSVLVLRLEGDLPEKPPLELPPFLSSAAGPRATVADVWMSLRKAAADSRIKAVVVEPEGLSAGWGKIEEIRADLEQFRKSGKPVYAYLRQPGSHEYYVACGAGRIYLGPSEPLMLKGLRAAIMYFKKTADKLGVAVQVEHAGKYKDFGDMFTRSDMSPETHEVMSSVVGDMYGNLVERIAAARHQSPADIRAIINQGPFTAPGALRAGLVDELRFEDQMWGELQGALHSGQPQKVALDDYMRVPASSLGLDGRNQIALVAAEGDIVRGNPDDDGSETGSLTSYGFDKVLRQVANDSSIKGVIVRIDSPGGEVTASDEIWRQMNLLNQKKPMVVSMSDVAASGGYYMAMTGAPIVAYPETETGSIGVVYGKPDLHGLYDKLGITKDAVQEGAHADIDSDYTPLSADEISILRKGIDESYVDFVSKVAAARHRPYAQIEPNAQGRVWLGSQAQQRGLVDQLGGLDTAVETLKRKAGIAAGENVAIDLYPAPRSLWDLLIKRSQPNALEARLQQFFGSIPFRAWLRGGYLREMPYWFEVR